MDRMSVMAIRANFGALKAHDGSENALQLDGYSVSAFFEHCKNWTGKLANFAWRFPSKLAFASTLLRRQWLQQSSAL